MGVAVSTSGSDMALAPAMIAQVRERLGRLPADWLMDGGFAGREAIARASAVGVRVLAPVQAPRDAARDPHQPVATDSAVLAAWRTRMGTDEARLTYRLRAATDRVRQRPGAQPVRLAAAARARPGQGALRGAVARPGPQSAAVGAPAAGRRRCGRGA